MELFGYQKKFFRQFIKKCAMKEIWLKRNENHVGDFNEYKTTSLKLNKTVQIYRQLFITKAAQRQDSLVYVTHYFEYLEECVLV